MGISISPGSVGLVIRGHGKKVEQAVDRAKPLTSARIVAFLKRISPVDQAHFKNAWQGDANGVRNDAPHAGIIERGARPHGVSIEGQQAIAEWAQRKFGVDEKEARSISFLICKKLKEHGQPGKYLVRNNLQQFLGWFQQEIERQLKAVS